MVLHYIYAMQREAIIKSLKETEPQLRDLGVASLFLFGSTARDEMREDSDVDVYIDKQDASAFGFSAFMSAYEILQHALPGRTVSYTTRDGLVEVYRNHIENTSIRVF